MQDSRVKLIKPVCPMCNSEFDQYYRVPRVIPKCGHTFCEKCITAKLQTKFNRKVFICSDCTSQTVIRKNVTDQIPKNISMIDILKNLKKQQFEEKELTKQSILNKSNIFSNDKKNSLIDITNICKIHNKQQDLICETCNNQRVCSHCMILNEQKAHQGHKLVDTIAASVGDIQELKQTFSIIEDSIQQTILPQSPHNIIRQSQISLLNGLKQAVHTHFKQYYKIIQKKQHQIIKQCQQIKLQGGIHQNMDKIVKNYDIIKHNYNQIIINKQCKPSLDFIQEFVRSCKNLHNQMVELEEYVQNQSKKMLIQISNKISQSVQFKIQEISFSIKNILQSKLQSPNKLAKSRFQQPLNAKDKSKDSKMHKNDSQSIKNQQKKKYSSFEFINSENTKANSHVPPRQKYQIQKANDSHESIQENLSSNQIPALNLKKTQKKNVNVKSSFATQRVNKNSKETLAQKKKSLQKPSESSEIITSRITNISTKSQKNNQPQDEKSLKLKEIRPTKQIAFQLRNKFQAIIKEIDRQNTNSTLQLIGMQVNDAILIHIVEYLRVHKLKFVMIKLVKNSLTDQGIAPLLSYLSHDNQTQVLNLTSNNLTGKCLDLIVQFAQQNSFLKTIYLTNNKVSAFQLKNKKKQFQKHQIQVIV